MSHVTCHMSQVTCHMSRVTCHVSSLQADAGGGQDGGVAGPAVQSDLPRHHQQSPVTGVASKLFVIVFLYRKEHKYHPLMCYVTYN